MGGCCFSRPSQGLRQSTSSEIIGEIEKHGIRGKLLSLIGDWLRNRKQRVYMKGKWSSYSVRNIITEEPSSISCQILAPTQAEVFGSPAACYTRGIWKPNIWKSRTKTAVHEVHLLG